MGRLTLFRSQNVLIGFILCFVLIGFSSMMLNADHSKNDFEALKLIEKAQELRKNQKYEEALSKLSGAVEISDDKELGALANLEMAYVKFLQGKNAIVYKMYIKKARQLNPSITPQEYNNEEFNKIFENTKPEKKNNTEVAKPANPTTATGETIPSQDILKKEIDAAKKEVEKWDKILYERRHWAERSDKAEKQAERKLDEAKKILETKAGELMIREQEQLSLKEKKEEKTEPAEMGELVTYERKHLFIFPVLYSKDISTRVLSGKRQMFLKKQMTKMFTDDFKRIDSYDVKAGDSIDAFLNDATAYVRRNSKKITSVRMTADIKFEEALVESDGIRKTIENSFAIVPFIDSIEKKVVKGEKSTDYVYNMYIHFDIYQTKTKEKLKTLKINNKKNILGALSSVTGSLQVDNSDLKGLPDEVKKDEKSFRNAIAGLLTVLKKKVKEMEQFRIMAILTNVSRSQFGFDMGKDTGIKIDNRYKTFVTEADGSKKMTGFGKIRKVEESASQAQILIGKPEEGDQVEEDPKVGINVGGGFGFVPLHIDYNGDKYAGGLNLCLSLEAEYELGPVLKLSELYVTFDLRIGMPAVEKEITGDVSISQAIFALGVTKKFYWRRWALNVGGQIGAHSAGLNFSWGKVKATSFGFSLHAGAEMLITPSISTYGGFNLDLYGTPSTYDDDGVEYQMSPSDKWSASGISLNFGVKVTL